MHILEVLVQDVAVKIKTPNIQTVNQILILLKLCGTLNNMHFLKTPTNILTL